MAALSFDEQKKRWRVNFLDATGKRRRRFFQMKDNARDFLKVAEDRDERVRNRLGWVEAISYEDALPLYRSEYLSLKSKSHFRRAWDRLRFLGRFLKSKPLCDVIFRDIEILSRERLSTGIANKTVNEDLTTLSSFFKWAVRRGLAVENPVTEVEFLPKLPRSFRRAYTSEEIERLLLHACTCCVPALAILANTGVRLGELEHLRKEDFHLEQKLLIVRHTEGTPVKGKENRVIPLNDALIQVVAPLPSGPILSIPRKRFEDHFRRVAKAARIDDAIPHGLRHTFVSHLVASGMDLLSVMRISGHRDIQTLQKYVHSTGVDLVPERNRVQFAVPYRCPDVTTKRTKWGEVRLIGQNETPENQAVTKTAVISRGSLMCREGDSNPHGFLHTPLKRTCLPFHHPGKLRFSGNCRPLDASLLPCIGYFFSIGRYFRSAFHHAGERGLTFGSQGLSTELLPKNFFPSASWPAWSRELCPEPIHAKSNPTSKTRRAT